MRNQFKFAVFSSGCALTFFCALEAQAQLDRLYLKADLGGQYTRDTELKEFFGSVSPGSKVTFDPGVRLGFAAGYWLTSWFAVEGETGVMANSIKSITDADRVDAQFDNVPFLINLRFQCPHNGFVTPYFGGGVGGSAAILDSDHLELNGVSVHGSDADTVFAYQAFAGLRFRINEQMSVGIEYHYFAADSPTWESDFAFGPNQIRFGRTETHAGSFTFHYSF